MKIYPVVENKFWIVTDLGSKIGTVRLTDKGYDFFDQRTGKKETLKDIKHLNQVSKENNNSNTGILKGYDTGVVNPIADNTSDILPTYRKTQGSKTVYCAGYYILKFHGMGWQWAFAPKLTTLTKYQYEGPFQTEWEMNLELKRKRRFKDDRSKQIPPDTD